MTHVRWIIILTVVIFAYFASAVLIPIFLSLFLAMLIDPVLVALTDRGVSRKISIYLVVLTSLLAILTVGWFLYLSTIDLFASFGSNPRIASLAIWLEKRAGTFDVTSFFSQPALSGDPGIQKVQVVEKYPGWFPVVLSGFGSLFEIIGLGVFVPMLLFYFLFEKEDLIESLNSILGQYLYIPTLNAELPLMIRTFFISNVITAFSLILAHGISFYLLGFTNWMALAVATGLMNIVPMIGAPAAFLTLIGTGLLAGGAEFPYLAALGVTLFLHLVFNNLVLPLLMGGRSNINTSSLIVGLLFWSWLWGAVGFLIAIPMTVLVKIFFESNSQTLPIANLMAARPVAVLPESASEAEGAQSILPTPSVSERSRSAGVTG